MTLKEYLEDYASADTKVIGDKLIAKEVETLGDLQSKVKENLVKIEKGERAFKF